MSTRTGTATPVAGPARSSRTPLWAGLLVIGIALVILGQFVLDSLADGNETWHWVQHATLFWGGLMSGAAVLRLYQLGGRQA